MRLLLSLLMLLPLNGQAQDHNEQELSQQPTTVFTADLQLLSRGEMRNGGIASDPDNPKSDDQSYFVLDRERLVLGFQRDWLSAKTTIQHVGVWGQEGSGSVGIYEGWAMLKANNGLFAQIGRLALKYDDERIIGPDDWSVASMTHDALKLGYERNGHQLHAILAYNQNVRVLEEPGSFYENGSRPYKTMHTLWYHYEALKFPLGLSLLFMNIGMQGGTKNNDPHTEYQQLAGGYLKFAPRDLFIEGSYYRQMGHDENGMPIKAWMASGKVNWKLNDICSFVAGYDYLSGDKYFAVPRRGQSGLTLHKEIGGFSPVYGSHHKFYGAMDFFYLSTYVNGFSPGLQNLFAGATFRPLKGLSLTGRYHYMAITTDLNDIDKTLGHVLEAEANYNIAKDVSLSAGFSYMTGTETMERLKRASGDGSLRWAWLSLNVSPRLLTTKF